MDNPNLLPTRKPKEDRSALWMGMGFVLVALAFPAYQALVWLQEGVWHPLPISWALHFMSWRVPQTDWVGLQKIIYWVLDLPILVVPAFMAFGCFAAWKDSLDRW
jgi:hypothetical protein